MSCRDGVYIFSDLMWVLTLEFFTSYVKINGVGALIESCGTNVGRLCSSVNWNKMLHVIIGLMHDEFAMCYKFLFESRTFLVIME